MKDRAEVIQELNFKKIAQGSFLLGTRWNREYFEYLMNKYTVFVDWFLKEVPQREITLPEYEISEIPVTIGMLKIFVQDTQYPLEKVPDLLRENLRQGQSDWPAFPTTPEIAEAFCQWLHGIDDNFFYDLPTEEEWEKAARGTDGREFPWGDIEDTHRVNTKESGNGQVLPVRHTSRDDSPYGIYDLAGNVEEMTRTFNEPYEGMPIRLPGYLRYRVLRGGTAEHHLDLARCARRHGKHPSKFTGFRVVRRKNRLEATSRAPEFRVLTGNFVFASINYVNDQEVSIDLGENRVGIVPAKQFTEHDFKVFANLHSRSEIILQIMNSDEEIAICRRPDLDELDKMMRNLNFDKVIQYQ